MNIIDLRLESSHIPTLAEWHHRQWSYLNPGHGLEHRIEKMQKYLGESLIPSMFIAKEGDTLLGSAGIVSHDMEQRMDLSPWLASVYVAPDYRKQGIGTALVRHVMSVAQNAGYLKLYLFTPDKANFYQGIGWITLAHDAYADSPVTIMEYLLSP